MANGAQEKLAEMAKAGDLLTEDEVKAIAYPLKPYTMKRPPSYVMAVVTQTVLKLLDRGYRKLPKDEPPLLSEEEVKQFCKGSHLDEVGYYWHFEFPRDWLKQRLPNYNW